MNNIYLIGAAIAGVLYVRGKKKIKADTTVQKGLDFTQATDWQGSAWDRINGALDMVLVNHPNLTQSAQADPGRVGLAASGIVATWNGGMA